jgi:hypothetical protein
MHIVYTRISQFLLSLTVLSSTLAWGAATKEEHAAPESASRANALAQSDGFPRNPTASEQVAMLEGETLEQALFRLKNVNLFFSPGPNQPGRIVWTEEDYVPISDESELFTVRVIMGNRRVLKLYEELAALPKATAADRVKERLGALFEEYRTLYAEDEEINSTENFTEADAWRQRALAANSLFGVGYVSNTPNPNDTTLAGHRYAVLSLVWLAGALELEGVYESIIRVAEEGIQQRNTIYTDEIHHDTYRESVLKYLSLYNRTLLGNALLGVSPRLRAEFDRSQGIHLERQTIERLRYNTPYSHLNPGIVHTPEAQIAIEFRIGFTDDLLDDLIRISKEQSR